LATSPSGDGELERDEILANDKAQVLFFQEQKYFVPGNEGNKNSEDLEEGFKHFITKIGINKV
jgi:hypothetical protein